MLWRMTSLTFLPSRSGRMVVADAYSSDNSLSRQLHGMKLSDEIGSHRNGRATMG
ncbi:unnamed protein product [Ascophyllum nodosum]